MSENIYEKNLQKAAEFQQNLADSVMKLYEQFDLQKSVNETITYQEKL